VSARVREVVLSMGRHGSAIRVYTPTRV
jgi:hypothetical protein